AGGPRKESQPSLAAKALLINERPAAALEVLTRFNQFQQAAELLMAQGKIAEALSLSEKAAKAETGSAYYARANHILLLHRLGDQKAGRDWLQTLAKDMAADANAANSVWLDRQIDLEVKLGLD